MGSDGGACIVIGAGAVIGFQVIKYTLSDSI
jgi:hypothetical protein